MLQLRCIQLKILLCVHDRSLLDAGRGTLFTASLVSACQKHDEAHHEYENDHQQNDADDILCRHQGQKTVQPYSHHRFLLKKSFLPEIPARTIVHIFCGMRKGLRAGLPRGSFQIFREVNGGMPQP